MVTETKKKTVKSNEIAKNKRSSNVRLYSHGVFASFRRGKRIQHENQAIIKIEGVKDRKDALFYLGKRVQYRYRVKPKLNPQRGHTVHNFRSIWGKVIAHHGNSGAVRTKFSKNLPPVALGQPLRVMLYPSQI